MLTLKQAMTQKIIDFSAIMLRPNPVLNLRQRSCAMVFHRVEGDVNIKVDSVQYDLTAADTLCTPYFINVILVNTLDKPSFVLWLMNLLAKENRDCILSAKERIFNYQYVL